MPKWLSIAFICPEDSIFPNRATDLKASCVPTLSAWHNCTPQQPSGQETPATELRNRCETVFVAKESNENQPKTVPHVFAIGADYVDYGEIIPFAWCWVLTCPAFHRFAFHYARLDSHWCASRRTIHQLLALASPLLALASLGCDPKSFFLPFLVVSANNHANSVAFDPASRPSGPAAALCASMASSAGPWINGTNGTWLWRSCDKSASHHGFHRAGIGPMLIWDTGWRRIRQPKQRIHQPTLRQPRFDNQGSTTKHGGFVNQGSSTKKLDSSTTRFVNQKSWIRQPKTADSSTKVRQPRFVNQGSSTKNPDSSTKDSSTKRLDSSTKNGGFINQGSSTKNTDSSTKDSSTKRLDSSTTNGGFINQGSSTKNTDSSTKDSSTTRLDSSKNGGFEGSGTFLACLEVEKLSLTCRCCVSCS